MLDEGFYNDCLLDYGFAGSEVFSQLIILGGIMRFAIPDYSIIFDLNEIMPHVRYDNGCMIWKGSYSKSKVPIQIIRFDGQVVSCKVIDIISATLFGRFVKLKNRRCKCKICVNPAHYMYIL